MARLGRRCEHCDAWRSPQRTLHHRGPQACDGADGGLAQRGDHGGTLGAAWFWHVRGREKEAAHSSDASVRGLSAGLAGARGRLGCCKANSVARVTPSKRRGPRSTGRLRRSRSGDTIGHCIDRENTASQAVARRLGASSGGRDGSARPCLRIVGDAPGDVEQPELKSIVAGDRALRAATGGGGADQPEFCTCRPSCVAFSTRSNRSSDRIASAS